MRRFLLGASAYAVCLPLLGIAWLLGLVGTTGVLAAAGLILAVNAAFFLAFRTRLNERFADPSLTWGQVMAGIAVVMFVVYELDSERSLALGVALVVLSFGAFRFSTREFLTASGLVLAAYAAVINLL